MNPHIEQVAFWQDFLREFLPAIRGRLVAQVRPKYIVMLDEHIYVQEHAPGPRRLVGRSDVSLAAPPRPRDEESAGVGILEAPCRSRSRCKRSAVCLSWRYAIVWAAN
jgi:hypothetical protein